MPDFAVWRLECQEDLLAEQAAHSQITSAVLVIFFVSLLGVGVGQTAVSTLGIPYIDDNVASRESPIYIGNWLDDFVPDERSIHFLF